MALAADDLWGIDGVPGSGLELYVPFKAWSSDSATGDTISASAAHLLDTQQATPGLGGSAQFGEFLTSDFPNQQFCSVVIRNFVSGSADVKLRWRHWCSPPGNANDRGFSNAGVWARVQFTTTPQNPYGLNEYHQNVTGYCWVLSYTPTTGLRHHLLKVVAGTIYVLATEALSGPGVEPWGSDNWQLAPRDFRLVVTTEGFNVRLRCYETVYPLTYLSTGLTTAGGSPKATTFTREIFATGGVLDNATIGGSALGNGRFGFGGQFQGVHSTYNDAFEATSFQWASAGSLNGLDDFSRAYRRGARQLADGFGINGRTLLCAYAGDIRANSSSGSPHYSHLVKETISATTGIRLGGQLPVLPGSQDWGWYVSQRPASDPSKQRRRFKINTRPGTLVDRQWGVHLHGNFGAVSGLRYNSFGLEKSGYLAALRYDAGTGTFNARLRHYPGDGTVISIAQLDDLSAFSFTYGDTIELDFECQTTGGTLPGDGSVSMRFGLGKNGSVITTLVNWTIPDGVLGVELSLDGEWVLDTRSVATLQGPHEAFYITDTQGYTTSAVLGQQWKVDDLSEPPIVLPDEQASYPVTTEADGAFGELTLPLSWSVQMELSDSAVRFVSEAGLRLTHTHRSGSRRRWRVRANRWTDAERDALLDFYDAHDGCELGFDWTPPEPDEAPTKVHFVTEDLRFRFRFTDTWSLEFELEEMFDAS